MPDYKIVIAEVIAVIPEYRQTVCESDGGWHYRVTRKTEGIPWQDLQEGDMVTLEVYTHLPIVKKVLNVNPIRC